MIAQRQFNSYSNRDSVGVSQVMTMGGCDRSHHTPVDPWRSVVSNVVLFCRFVGVLDVFFISPQTNVS